MAGRQASEEANWLEQKKVLTENRNYIVENLDADDVIDHLIQEKILGQFLSCRPASAVNSAE